MTITGLATVAGGRRPAATRAGRSGRLIDVRPQTARIAGELAR